MQRKTIEKFLRKLINKQRYFIDSSVLIEIIYKQDSAENCKRFINGIKVGNKTGIVSNSAMGEVFCTLFFNEVGLDRNSLINAFEALNELVKDFCFVTIDKETINMERKIREEEGDWLQQMDLLNLSSAKRFKSVAFVTLDPDFSKITGEKLGIKIINLKE